MTLPEHGPGRDRLLLALATVAAEYDALAASRPGAGRLRAVDNIDELAELVETCLPESTVRVLVDNVEAVLVGAVTDATPSRPGTVWLLLGERGPIDPAAWACRRPIRS